MNTVIYIYSYKKYKICMIKKYRRSPEKCNVSCNNYQLFIYVLASHKKKPPTCSLIINCVNFDLFLSYLYQW